MEFKVLDKNLYWSMDNENNCTSDLLKIMEYFEKTKDAHKKFDDMLNYLFHTEDEVINYIFTKKNSRTGEAFARNVFYNKAGKIIHAYPINNSYFCGINEKTCKRADLKNNNVVAMITNIVNNNKIEVYISETNFSRYNSKINKIVPVIVFNLPEHAEERIYCTFLDAFKRLFKRTKCKTPNIHPTHKPIIDAKERKKLICKINSFNEEHYEMWLNGEVIW